MVIRQGFWVSWIYLTILSSLLAREALPLSNSTIEEKLNRIKILSGPSRIDYEETIDVRFAIGQEILRIADRKNPEAVSALIDLVLYKGFEEYDAPLADDSPNSRVSHTAVLALLDQPLTEFPALTGSDLPDSPAFSHPDPTRRKRALRVFYGSTYRYALRDCRAWCQEVRDGKRTFQIKGSKLRYNSLGKPVNAPPPRTHNHNPPDSQAEESRSPTAESHPAISWVVLLLSLVIVITMIRLHRKN